MTPGTYTGQFLIFVFATLFVLEIGRSRAGVGARVVDTDGTDLKQNTPFEVKGYRAILMSWLARGLFNCSLIDSVYHVVGLVLA
jgi:hypothetical protein